MDATTLPDGAAQLRLPQQSTRAARTAAGWLHRCRRARAPSVGAASADRGVSRHQHLRHPRDRARLSAAAIRQTAPCRRTSITPPPTIRSRSPTSYAGAAARRPRGRGLHRLLLERQGIRVRAAHDQRRADRCRGRRRRGFVVSDDAVRLSFAAAHLAHAVPAVRRGARWHFDRRGRGLCAARAAAVAASTATRSCCWAPANRATPITCRVRIRKAAVRARDAAGAHGGRACARATSTTSTCTAPAPPATTAPRISPSRRCLAARHRLQLDQGCHRSRAGRRRRARSGHLRAGNSTGLHARRPQHDRSRPEVEPQLPA